MKQTFFTMLIAIVMAACCNESCNKKSQPVKVPEGIIKTLEYYAEGSRKADSKITRRAFTDNATMSWIEDGKLQSVPIQGLYDFVESNQAMEVNYTVSSCDIADDVAIVRIESQFGDAKYADMFSMLNTEDGWKIVSKIYHLK